MYVGSKDQIFIPPFELLKNVFYSGKKKPQRMNANSTNTKKNRDLRKYPRQRNIKLMIIITASWT